MLNYKNIANAKISAVCHTNFEDFFTASWRSFFWGAGGGVGGKKFSA